MAGSWGKRNCVFPASGIENEPRVIRGQQDAMNRTCSLVRAWCVGRLARSEEEAYTGRNSDCGLN